MYLIMNAYPLISAQCSHNMNTLTHKADIHRPNGSLDTQQYSGGAHERLSLYSLLTYQINYFGPIRLTNAMLPLLRASQGRVVMVSSVAGRVAT